VPLDPQARALIDTMQAAGAPVETLTPEQARDASAQRRARMPVEAEPVADVHDRIIDGPGGPLTVRVYRPEAENILPVVVFFHGGGWVMCDLDSHDGFCRTVTNAVGCVVVSVDYRRAPEHPYPAAAEDAYAATAWVAANAAGLGVDPHRLVVMGDSAGGNLAAAVTLLARDRGGPAIALQSLLYPVTDRDFETSSYQEFGVNHFLTTAAMKWYWKHYLADSADPDGAAAPLRATDLTGLPPAHVVTAECDPLRDEGMAYAQRLAESGVPTRAKSYEGGFHGFLTLPPLLEVTRLATAEVCGVLRDTFVAGPIVAVVKSSGTVS
jgi:acetyl esterase